jgi:hypothetical protein
MSKPSIYVATPAYGGMVHALYHTSMLKLSAACQADKVELVHGLLMSESLIQRARNRLVRQFLETTCTHLFFVDADIGFDVRSPAVMAMSGLEVVGGVYAKKTINWQAVHAAARQGLAPERLAEAGTEYCFNPKHTGGDGRVNALSIGDEAFIESHDVPTGFLMIRREAIEKMIEAYPETRYLEDSPKVRDSVTYALFDCFIDPVDQHYLSEDWGFCRRWQRIGGKTWAYPGAHLMHVGAHHYEADLTRRLRAAPTLDAPADASTPASPPSPP